MQSCATSTNITNQMSQGVFFDNLYFSRMESKKITGKN